MDICPLHPEGIGVPEVLTDILVSEFKGIHILLPGTVDNLVIDISEVLNISDAVALVFQVPPDGIKDHQWAGIPQVNKVVCGGAASIDLHLLRHLGQ
jgi:hypothetical protein